MLPSFGSPILTAQEAKATTSTSLRLLQKPAFTVHLLGAVVSHKNRVYCCHHFEGIHPVSGRCCTPILSNRLQLLMLCQPMPQSASKSVVSGAAVCSRSNHYHWVIPFSSFVCLIVLSSDALHFLDQD